MKLTKLPEAELDALRARDRFFDTAAAVEVRLEPSHLMADAATVARTGMSRLVRGVARRARRRPVTASATAAGLALLLMRRPLLRAIRRTL